MIPYDGSPKALFFPETRTTVFGTSDIPSEEALAIEAARLAYLHFETNAAAKAELSASLRAAGFEAPMTFNDRKTIPIGFFTDSQGFAAFRKDDRLAVLAFRGTQPTRPRDILLDLDFGFGASKPWPGRIHHGFLQAALALWQKVEPWLSGAGAERKRLLVCGHSLGAAIATLIAMRANAERLITLGTPRIGDDEFVKGLQATHIHRTRIVNSVDIVTQIPPSFLGYRHANDGVFIDDSGRVVTSPEPGQVDADVGPDVLFHLALPHIGALPPVLSDHATVNYLRAYWP